MREHATLWSAAASITRFVCDFDVDVSGRVPQDRRLSWSVWMWPLSATSWSRCSETAAILHFQLGWRIPTALSQRRAVTAALRRPVGCHVTGRRIPSGQWETLLMNKGVNFKPKCIGKTFTILSLNTYTHSPLGELLNQLQCVQTYWQVAS